MKAVLVEFGQGMAEVREVKTPKPGSGEVAVRPLRIGLDGTLRNYSQSSEQVLRRTLLVVTISY